MRALVIGDDTRSFLAIVRSLGRQGWTVDAAPFDFSSPALSSRYIRQVRRLPPYALGPDRWVRTLAALIAEQDYALIVPCDDRSLIPLHEHAAALDAARLAIPNPEAMAVFFDKVETRRLAASLGVPIAEGKPLEPADSSGDLVRRFGLPLALKPRSSFLLGQVGGKSSVRIVTTVGELEQRLADIDLCSSWLVESFFQGEGCGFSVLADRGRIVLAFQHRRLAEASAVGGSSSRIGEKVDRALQDAVSVLARATSLHGVAMFEFRRDPASRRFVLLEVNCRFWGSLPLAVASGADFPAMAARLYLDDRVTPGGASRDAVVMRDLSGEFYRRLTTDPDGQARWLRTARAGLGVAGLLAASLRARGFDAHADDDPVPLRRERRELARVIVGGIARRLVPLGRRRHRLRTALRRWQADLDRGRRDVILLCHGNICRSPFAEHLLRDRAAAAGLDLRIRSAGTIEREGRPSPPVAIATAARHGVDLSEHRSRYIDTGTAATAGMIVIFDDRNADELRRLGLEGANVLRLPDLIGSREIGDPWGGGPAEFDRVYAEIAKATDTLVAAAPVAVAPVAVASALARP